MNTLWIKPRPFNDIVSGDKQYEVRKKSPFFASIKSGKDIILSTRTNNTIVKITDIYEYSCLQSIFDNIDFKYILPHMDSVEQSINFYNELYKNTTTSYIIFKLKID